MDLVNLVEELVRSRSAVAGESPSERKQSIAYLSACVRVSTSTAEGGVERQLDSVLRKWTEEWSKLRGAVQTIALANDPSEQRLELLSSLSFLFSRVCPLPFFCATPPRPIITLPCCHIGESV